MLKVLVLSLYNSVLNTCARDSRKRRRCDAPVKITGKRTKNMCAKIFLLLDPFLLFAGNIEYEFSTRILGSESLHDENVCIV